MTERITDAVFDERFKPEMNEAGDGYRQYDNFHGEGWEAEREMLRGLHAAGRVWTCLDTDDGSWALANGMHRVNRQYYVICAVPYTAGVLIDVYDPDEPPRCPECGCFVESGECRECSQAGAEG